MWILLPPCQQTTCEQISAPVQHLPTIAFYIPWNIQAKLETDKNKESFQYSSTYDWADDTNRYLPLSHQRHALYRYHWAGQYTSLRPKGLHLLSEMIFNKV